MSSAASIVQAVLAFFVALLGLKREIDAQDAGQLSQQTADQQQVLDDVQKAQAARAELLGGLAADPAKLREPDEFTRSD